MVKDINHPGRLFEPASADRRGRHAVLLRQRRDHGRELWKSDGTEAGTVLVKDINPNGRISPERARRCRAARSSSPPSTAPTGNELWKSDGTEAGTVLVKDINPNGSSHPSALTDVGGTLFFSAADGTTATSCGRATGRRPGR